MNYSFFSFSSFFYPSFFLHPAILPTSLPLPPSSPHHPPIFSPSHVRLLPVRQPTAHGAITPDEEPPPHTVDVERMSTWHQAGGPAVPIPVTRVSYNRRGGWVDLIL